MKLGRITMLEYYMSDVSRAFVKLMVLKLLIAIYMKITFISEVSLCEKV